MMKAVALALSLSLVLTTPLAAQDGWQEATDAGLTDWSNGYVEATGQGTSRYMGNRIQEELMARQAARTTAQARLLEIIKGIRLTGLSTIGAKGAGDTRAATRIKGTLRGARSVSDKVSWHTDKTSRRGETVLAEVTLRLCMTPACQETKVNLTDATLGLDPETMPDAAPAPTETSAVIIDLQQALYLPALAPEIINEQNQTIYSPASVNEQAATQNGLTHYAKTVDTARSLPQSGANPLVVPAQRISKDNRIVLSDKNAAKIANHAALKEGRLIIALD